MKQLFKLNLVVALGITLILFGCAEQEIAPNEAAVGMDEAKAAKDVSVFSAPFAKISYENEYFEYDNYREYEEADVFLNFYTDESMTQPFFIRERTQVDIEIVRKYTFGSGSPSITRDRKTVLIQSFGTSIFRVFEAFVLLDCRYGAGGENEGCLEVSVNVL